MSLPERRSVTQMAEVIVWHSPAVHVLGAERAGRTRLGEVLGGRVGAVAAVRSGGQV